MAWQSLSGMGGGGNGGGGGEVQQQTAAQPQGTEYTLQGMHIEEGRGRVLRAELTAVQA
jgi:hypothetical protein